MTVARGSFRTHSNNKQFIHCVMFYRLDVQLLNVDPYVVRSPFVRLSWVLQMLGVTQPKELKCMCQIKRVPSALYTRYMGPVGKQSLVLFYR